MVILSLLAIAIVLAAMPLTDPAQHLRNGGSLKLDDGSVVTSLAAVPTVPAKASELGDAGAGGNPDAPALKAIEINGLEFGLGEDGLDLYLWNVEDQAFEKASTFSAPDIRKAAETLGLDPKSKSENIAAILDKVAGAIAEREASDLGDSGAGGGE